MQDKQQLIHPGITHTTLFTLHMSTSEFVKIQKEETLSDQKYPLKKVTFQHRQTNGQWVTQSREVFQKGDAAAILLYNPEEQTVILTRQFRLPAYLNGDPTGLLLETCAGMLDEDGPEEGIRRETEEETGYRIQKVQKVFEAYMSPGALTEKLYFFIGEYRKELQVSRGGGLEEEHEDIEVLEVPFGEAYGMIESGEIVDAKTILLLQYAKIQLFNNG